MGDNRAVQVVISAKDLASSVFKDVAATLAAAFSIREVYEFGKAAVEAASAQEDAEAKLAAALGRTSQALLNQASAMQDTTKFTDESIISAQAQVAAFSKNEQAIQRVTKAAADFASAKGMDIVSASEIITKSIFGQMNMLGRYGIQLEGAAGSSERLDTAMRKLEDHFGGQAAAQAQTYSGQVAELSHSYDDLLKSIGRMITENPAVVETMGMLKDVFADLGKWVQDNRVWLMELVKSGIIYLIQGIGGAIQVVGLFHVTWLELKLGVGLAIAWIAEKVNGLYDILRTGLLDPFDALFKALVDIGAMSTNPFDNIKLGLLQWQQQSELSAASMAGDLSETANGYATVFNRIADIKDFVTNVEIPAVKAGTKAVTEKGDAHELTAKQIAEQMKLEVDYLKQLSALYTVYGSTKPEMQKMDLTQFDAETAARMAAMKAQNATADAMHAEEANRFMARGVLVEQQLQQNESVMASITRMAQTYDMAGGIMEARQEELNRVKQAGTNIHLAADKAMETQLLRLVEAHKFSVGAIGQAIMQGVKMEILGIAAKAAVYAIFYAAYGLGLLAMGDSRSTAAFAAAAEFGTIAGVATAAAAAVNLVSGPGAQPGAQGSNPSNPTYTSSVPSPTIAGQQNPSQQISISVHGIITPDTMDNLTEEYIIPAINRAGNRNVQLTIQTA